MRRLPLKQETRSRVCLCCMKERKILYTRYQADNGNARETFAPIFILNEVHDQDDETAIHVYVDSVHRNSLNEDENGKSFATGTAE